MGIKLPLTPDELQGYIDRANPYEIPALVDALSRCQDVLAACRRETWTSHGSDRAVRGMIDQILTRKDDGEKEAVGDGHGPPP